jgi:hypothetical protein
MPNVMLLIIFQHAHVLQDSQEILSQTVEKPCKVGFCINIVFDGGSGGNDDYDEIYAWR